MITTAPDYIIGLDLGQVNDYSAVAALEVPVWVESDEARQMFRAVSTGWISPDRLASEHVQMLRSGEHGRPPEGSPMPLSLRHLDRWRGIAYPRQVRRVAALMDAHPFRGRAVLVVDKTGVGRAVYDELHEAGLEPVGVTITGGDVVSREGQDYRVPKRDIVGALQMLMMQSRLRIPRRMPHADTLIREMENFKVKINVASGHDSYEAWREHEHDDLLLAACIAAWYWRHLTAHRPTPSMVFGPSGRMR
jgi:hypothetical protein